MPAGIAGTFRMHPLSVAVAGCGPAGLATALFLARAGHDVTLIERFDTPKPLGSGLMLQPTGLAVLAELGLGAAILGRGARIARLFGRSHPSGRPVLDVHYGALGPDAFGLAVHRSSLFDTLHEAVRLAEIPIHAGFDVAGVGPPQPRGRTVIGSTGETLGPFDLVVDALGMRSPLPSAVLGHPPVRALAYGALWATLPWVPDGPFAKDALEQRYRRASVMVGVLPIGRRSVGGMDETAFFWSLKPAHYDDWRRAGLAAWKDNVRRVWPETDILLAAIRDPEQMVLARYSHHTLPRPAAPGIAFVGDCAHSASPQLGQGANMALLDAYALSLALASASDMNTALARYVRLRRRHVITYQVMSRLFTPIYQSDSAFLPFIRDRLVAPIARSAMANRILSELVAGTLVSPLRNAWPPRPQSPVC